MEAISRILKENYLCAKCCICLNGFSQWVENVYGNLIQFCIPLFSNMSAHWTLCYDIRETQNLCVLLCRDCKFHIILTGA